MISKFESKSNRVKGLSFHSVRPWILAALHNGVVQLWDYEMKVLLERYDEHDGPVRGVDFHSIQPLFVSGGDDYKIKIWNYKLRRCLFTLLGHLDYIRTVAFHKEHPWVVSASDDQTIRIWNWQSRSCIAVLTGHNHYVMCAAFHPSDDMVVSASLDQTVRVWDTSGLRKKTVHGVPTEGDGGLMHLSSRGAEHKGVISSRVNSDLFGAGDAVVKYILEGHDRGVNWASFHPSLPLVISGADDRQVKLWRMNETKAWEVDTLRGHTNNVSSALFHPKQDLIISNSEDRSIRVWDSSKRLGVFTYRKEHDRFWILTSHPTKNLLAAGHDSGLIVFKLQRERLAYATKDRQLLYVKDRYLRMYDYPSKRDVPIINLRRSTSTSVLGSKPYSLSINALNQAEYNVLIWSALEGGSYELLTYAKSGSGNADSEPRKGSGLAAVFIARNRIAVLELKSRNILVKNLHNDLTKRLQCPVQGVDGMFFAGLSGRIILQKEDKLFLFETNSRKILSELQVPRVKRIVWNSDHSLVACMSKSGVTICDRQLNLLSQTNEPTKVKSGAWDENNIFIFTTVTHIKYCLPSGDSGLVRSLSKCVYATKVVKSIMYCLDREGKPRALKLDMTEAMFKLYLMKEKYNDVMVIIRKSHMCGQSILAYLTEKGFPQIALYFVKNDKTRFDLALECGDIQVATQSAKAIDELKCWGKLGAAALQQGKHEVVELSYQRGKSFEKLSFLYLITGNVPYLSKMLKIAQMRNDVMSRFHNALYLGDVEERVRILEEVGQISLAYVLSSTHHLEATSKRLEQRLVDSEQHIPTSKTANLLLPPIPILCKSCNWPEIAVKDDVFAAAVKNKCTSDEEKDEGEEDIWGDNNDESVTHGNSQSDVDADYMDDENAGGGDWADDDDDDLFGGDDVLELDGGNDHPPDKWGTNSNGVYIAPNPRGSPCAEWIKNSALAGDHAAAGSFVTAMKLLNRQIGVVNFIPLKHFFEACYQSSKCLLPMSNGTNAGASYITRSKNIALPKACVRLELLASKIKAGYRAFVSGKFNEAKKIFLSVLHSAPLLIVDSRKEENDVKEMLAICREYILAVMLKLKTKEMGGGQNKRSMELAAYMTHCNLLPTHSVLALRTAMTQAYKMKNYITAETFARRVLDLSPTNKKIVATAKKIVQISHKEGRNAVNIDYNSKEGFSICCKSFKAMSQTADPPPYNARIVELRINIHMQGSFALFAI